MGKRVVVTGASGFVGAALSRRLVEAGHDVHLWCRPGTDGWRLTGVDAERHFVDLEDEERVSSELDRTGADWIFHLAAHGAYPTQTDWRQMIGTNVTGTLNLLHSAASHGFDAFVNTGSSSEYGFVDHAPSEDERAEPNSDYAAAKLSQTTFCRAFARARSLHVPTLRLYSVYGPYEAPSRLVPTLIRRGLIGQLPPLVAPDVARDFIHVDDVVSAFLLAAERRTSELGPIYNIGTGRQTTLREASELSRKVFALEVEPTWGTMPPRVWDTSTWVSDPRKAASSLGFATAIAFEDGFARFAEWVREHGPALGVYA